MEFLDGTKQILRYLNLYTRPPVSLSFIEVSSRFIEYFAFISMTITTCPIAAFCFVNRNNFKEASAGVLYLIANSSIKIIYLTLLIKQNVIIGAIDHLESFIVKSKISLGIFIPIYMKLKFQEIF